MAYPVVRYHKLRALHNPSCDSLLGDRADRAASRAGVPRVPVGGGDEQRAARRGQARHLRRREAAGAQVDGPPLRQLRRQKRE